jgi:hypothetical protein
MKKHWFTCAIAILFALGLLATGSKLVTPANASSTPAVQAAKAKPAPAAKAKPAAAKEHSWTGWITDTKCGAKGANAAHADCLKKCIAAGEKYALYVPATKKLYKLEPQDKVAEHGAHHVRVKGTVAGDTIHVASISMVAEKKAAKAKPAAKTTKQ